MFCRHSRDFDRPYRFGRHIALGLVIAIVVAVVFGGVVMLAWNAVMPAAFALPALTFWQAVALLVLARLLTGRLTHHGRGWHHHRRHNAGRPSYGQWWKAEGQAAFQAYARRQQEQADDRQP